MKEVTLKSLIDKNIFSIMDSYILSPSSLNDDVLNKFGFTCDKWKFSNIICNQYKSFPKNQKEQIEIAHNILIDKNIGKNTESGFSSVSGKEHVKVRNKNESCSYKISKDEDMITGRFNVKNLNLSVEFEFYNLDKILRKLDVLNVN